MVREMGDDVILLSVPSAYFHNFLNSHIEPCFTWFEGKVVYELNQNVNKT